MKKRSAKKVAPKGGPRTRDDIPNVQRVSISENITLDGSHTRPWVGNSDFSEEFVAAHEAGHALAFLLVGIPVAYVECERKADGGRVQYGWTEACENAWMKESELPRESKLVRRILGKVGASPAKVFRSFSLPAP